LILRPSIHQAAECLLSGNTAQDLADSAGLELSTAWAYTTTAAMHVHQDDLRQVTKQLVSRDMWKALSRMAREENVLLSGPLKELMFYMEEELNDDGAFLGKGDVERWGEVRLARMCFASRV
jgi:succinylglutamate desuccinylase